MTLAVVQQPGNIPDLFGVVKCRHCGRYGLIEDDICLFCKKPLDGPWAIIDKGGSTPRIIEAAPGFSSAYAVEIGGRPVFEREGKITAMDVLQAGPVDLLEQNRNWQCLICGPPGTGKTYSGIRIAEMLDSKFAADKIVFDTVALIDLLGSVGPREFIIYDEAEGFNARQSQKSENIELSKIIAMIRFTQINIIYCLPHLKMIDVNARRVILNYLHTIPFNRKRSPLWMRNKSGVYWYDIKMPRIPMPGNDAMEPSFTYPWVKGEQVSKVWLLMADPTVLEEYERAKGRLWHQTLRSAKETILARRAKQAAELGQRPPSVTQVAEGTYRQVRQTEMATDRYVDEILGSSEVVVNDDTR